MLNSLALSICITVVILLSKREQVWFDGRAVAESVKSLTWRYITASEPFLSSLDNQHVNWRFLQELNQIKEKRKDIPLYLSNQDSNSPQITEEMKNLRALLFDKRRDFYLSCRIKDQLRWYNSKAEENYKWRDRWFIAIVISQLLALISAILHALWPIVPVNSTGFFAALATAFLSWLQVKRHQDLSQSYALAAQELETIESLVDQINSDESLSAFVSQTESAISREHTLWVVRSKGLF